MSTTDSREAFLEWKRDEGDIPNYIPDATIMASGYSDFELKAWQAALAWQAAKATGTAGELPPLIGMEVSMDVSTGDEDFDHRVFGRIEGLMAKGDGTDIILAVEESRNFAADTQAARQPAPVVDDEAPKRVIDYITAFDKRLIGRGFDHAQRMEIVGLLVSKETQDAALAATAAPVLSDEQINDLWNSLPGIEIHNKAYAQGMSTDYALRIAFAKAILAATNRSQP